MTRKLCFPIIDKVVHHKHCILAEPEHLKLEIGRIFNLSQQVPGTSLDVGLVCSVTLLMHKTLEEISLKAAAGRPGISNAEGADRVVTTATNQACDLTVPCVKLAAAASTLCT